MATGGDVLKMLCSSGGWVIYGDDFDSIIWTDGKALCTELDFKAGFAKVDAWNAEQQAKAAADRASATNKLEALGLTADDLKALGL